MFVGVIGEKISIMGIGKSYIEGTSVPSDYYEETDEGAFRGRHNQRLGQHMEGPPCNEKKWCGGIWTLISPPFSFLC